MECAAKVVEGNKFLPVGIAVCVCVHVRQVSTRCPEIRERDIREVVEVLLFPRFAGG